MHLRISLSVATSPCAALYTWRLQQQAWLASHSSTILYSGPMSPDSRHSSKMRSRGSTTWLLLSTFSTFPTCVGLMTRNSLAEHKAEKRLRQISIPLPPRSPKTQRCLSLGFGPPRPVNKYLLLISRVPRSDAGSNLASFLARPRPARRDAAARGCPFHSHTDELCRQP